MMAPVDKVVVSTDDRKYNFSALLVARTYREVEKVFGDVVVIGGRAVNIHCSLDYRRTNDVDFLVGGELTRGKRERFISYGWKPAPNAAGDGRHEHFEKEVTLGGETHLVMIDINTAEGPSSLVSLPNSFDRNAILEGSTEATIVRGQYSESIRIASVPMLVAMKVATAMYMAENGTERQKKCDAVTHMEDVYMLISIKYGSLEAFMEKELGDLEFMLKDWQYKAPIRGALKSAFEIGRICTRGGAAWTLKEKVRIDSATRMLRSSDDWLAKLADERIMKALELPASRKSHGTGRSAAYPDDLLKKFYEMYAVFLRGHGSLEDLVNVLNNQTGMHKKAIRSELGEIFTIAAGQFPDWKTEEGTAEGTG
jgi:hypothetical protein